MHIVLSIQQALHSYYFTPFCFQIPGPICKFYLTEETNGHRITPLHASINGIIKSERVLDQSSEIISRGTCNQLSTDDRIWIFSCLVGQNHPWHAGVCDLGTLRPLQWWVTRQGRAASFQLLLNFIWLPLWCKAGEGFGLWQACVQSSFPPAANIRRI